MLYPTELRGPRSRAGAIAANGYIGLSAVRCARKHAWGAAVDVIVLYKNLLSTNPS